MNVLQVRAKMEELVLMTPTRTLVIALSGMQVKIVKRILMNAHQTHVYTMEHALMESIHLPVIAFPGIPETIVNQVTYNRYQMFDI